MALDLNNETLSASATPTPQPSSGGRAMRSALTAEGLTNVPSIAPPLPPAPVGGSLAYDAGVVLGATASALGEVFGGIFGSDKKKPETTAKAGALPVPGTNGPSPFNM